MIESGILEGEANLNVLQVIESGILEGEANFNSLTCYR